MVAICDLAERHRTLEHTRQLAEDCARHARMLFNTPDFDLDQAAQGTWSIVPTAPQRTPSHAWRVSATRVQARRTSGRSRSRARWHAEAIRSGRQARHRATTSTRCPKGSILCGPLVRRVATEPGAERCVACGRSEVRPWLGLEHVCKAIRIGDDQAGEQPTTQHVGCAITSRQLLRGMLLRE
jgi:hypothetical protein